ncbi:MAG: hypothetical protein KBD17_02605, partial [Candidatus Pacebacteria bacterium]|nr:hypothetical protein [Candidatus Paceibacterota bacterium]
MEGSIPTTPEAKPEIQELSVEHFSRLVFLSFRFSQGEPQLQRYILKWVSSAFPSYRITPANLELAYGRIKAMASNFVLKNRGPHTSTMDNQPITEDIVGKQVKDFSNALAEYLWGTSSESEQDKETILINIA